jgi:riboflavin synthase
MFTGLIESVGRIGAVDAMPGGVRLRVGTDLASRLAPGDSLATSGVCLTIVEAGQDAVAMDVSPETLRVTTLGTLRAGSLVNLERPVRPDALMGGHFVQGHVDATGEVTAVVNEGEFWRFSFTYPAHLAALLIPKGSIAVDGISLTVAALRSGEFDVQIIPHTWSHTNLHAVSRGDAVNLECDMLGKYVVRIAELAGWAGRQTPSPQETRSGQR